MYSSGRGLAGHYLWAAAVHLQGADSSGEHGYVGFQSAEAALDVPEFFKTDVRSKAGLGNMIVE